MDLFAKKKKMQDWVLLVHQENHRLHHQLIQLQDQLHSVKLTSHAHIRHLKQQLADVQFLLSQHSSAMKQPHPHPPLQPETPLLQPQHPLQQHSPVDIRKTKAWIDMETRVQVLESQLKIRNQELERLSVELQRERLHNILSTTTTTIPRPPSPTSQPPPSQPPPPTLSDKEENSRNAANGGLDESGTGEGKKVKVLLDTIAQLQRTVTQLNSHNNQLQQQLQHHSSTTTSGELCADLKHLQDKIDRLAPTSSDTPTTLHDHDHDQSQHDSVEQDYGRLFRQSQEMNQQQTLLIRQLHADHKQLTQSLHHKQQLIETLNGRIQELEQQQMHGREQVHAAPVTPDMDADAVLREKRQLEEELCSLRHQLDDQTSQATEWKHKFEKMKAVYVQVQQQHTLTMDDDDNQHHGDGAHDGDVVAEWRELKERVRVLEQENHQLKSHLDANTEPRQRSDQVDSKSESLSSAQRKYKELVVKLDQERDEWQRQLDAKTEQLAHLQSQLHDLHLRRTQPGLPTDSDTHHPINNHNGGAARSSQKQAQLVTETQLEMARDQIKKLQQDLLESQTESRNLQSSLSTQTRQNAQLTQQLTLSDHSLVTLHSQLDSLTKQVSELEDLLKTRTEEKDQVMMSYRKLVLERREVDDRVQRAEEECTRLRAQWELANRDLTDARRVSESQQSHLVDLTAQLETARSEIQTLTTSLTALESDLERRDGENKNFEAELVRMRVEVMQGEKRVDEARSECVGLSVECKRVRDELEFVLAEKNRAVEMVQRLKQQMIQTSGGGGDGIGKEGAVNHDHCRPQQHRCESVLRDDDDHHNTAQTTRHDEAKSINKDQPMHASIEALYDQLKRYQVELERRDTEYEELRKEIEHVQRVVGHVHWQNTNGAEGGSHGGDGGRSSVNPKPPTPMTQHGAVPAATVSNTPKTPIIPSTTPSSTTMTQMKDSASSSPLPSLPSQMEQRLESELVTTTKKRRQYEAILARHHQFSRVASGPSSPRVSLNHGSHMNHDHGHDDDGGQREGEGMAGVKMEYDTKNETTQTTRKYADDAGDGDAGGDDSLFDELSAEGALALELLRTWKVQNDAMKRELERATEWMMDTTSVVADGDDHVDGGGSGGGGGEREQWKDLSQSESESRRQRGKQKDSFGFSISQAESRAVDVTNRAPHTTRIPDPPPTPHHHDRGDDAGVGVGGDSVRQRRERELESENRTLRAIVQQVRRDLQQRSM